MSVTLTSTGVQFSDGSSQSSAAEGGGAVILTYLTTGTHNFDIPSGATVMKLTGCGAGGGRPTYRVNYDNSYVAKGGGGGAGCQDYVVQIPTGHVVGRVVIGTPGFSHGPATTVATGATTSALSTRLTLGGGSRGQVSGNNGSGGGGGNPSPAVSGFTAGGSSSGSSTGGHPMLGSGSTRESWSFGKPIFNGYGRNPSNGGTIGSNTVSPNIGFGCGTARGGTARRYGLNGAAGASGFMIIEVGAD